MFKSATTITIGVDLIKSHLIHDSNGEKSDKSSSDQKAKSASSSRPKLWITSTEKNSGIVGLINCIRREPGCQAVRCFLSPDASDSLASIPNDILDKDLVMNIYDERLEKFGSFRHCMIEEEDVKKATSHAYVDIKTKGDMSSFRWVENPTKYFKELTGDLQITGNESLVNVHYAALNFKDVMIASGRISMEAYPSILGSTGSYLGMEFSGLDENGNRVMGYTIGKGMATEVVSLDPLFLWPVPTDWTLEEASSVPVVYATVYYGLLIRAGLQPGETVLIHR